MPTQEDPSRPAGTNTPQDDPKTVQAPGSKTPCANGTARRPGPPKPVTFKDFASI